MPSSFGQQRLKNLHTAKCITDKGSVVQSFKVNSHETNCLELLIFHTVTNLCIVMAYPIICIKLHTYYIYSVLVLQKGAHSQG